MKLIISAVILFSLLQISTQFAFRNDFEDDDILEVYERHARDTSATTVTAEASKEIIEASGEEPLPKKSVVKRDKPETEVIEASGQSSEESEEVEKRPKRSAEEKEVIEGSGEDDAAGRQRRVAGEEIIEASGEEAATATTTITA